MTSVITFLASALLFGGFIGVKYWEWRRGVTLLPQVRNKADIFVAGYAHRLYLQGVHFARRATRHAQHHSAQKANELSRQTLYVAERGLTHLLEKIRGRSKLLKRGKASQYLMDVRAHKNDIRNGFEGDK